MGTAARSIHEVTEARRVCGDYVIDGVTSSPVGATVYTAHRAGRADERYVVRALPCADVATASRFRRVMAHAQRVEHRALAPIAAFEAGSSGAVVVQRSAGGETLRERLAQGALNPAAAGWLVAEVAAALDALHAARPTIVHGALCPANITVDEARGVVSLEAAGIADALGVGEWPPEVVAALREPGYTSPDEAVGRPSPRADTFVLACIAYECLTGERPFAGADDASVHAQILAASPRSLRERRPELDEAVDEVLARAWRLDRDGAFESSFAFAMELARALVIDASQRPTWNPEPKHSGVRVIAEEPAAAPARPVDEAEVSLDDLVELEALDEDAGQRNTLSWGEVPLAPMMAPESAAVSARPSPAAPPRPIETLELDAVAPAFVDLLDHPVEQETVAPPSRYRAWAGTVSRPESPMAPPPSADESHLRDTPLFVPRPPRAPQLDPSPHLSETPVVGTPVPSLMRPPAETVPAPTKTPSAHPRRALRPLLRPATPAVERGAAASKVGLPAALVLGFALVTAAVIVTAGQVYVAKLRARSPAVERVVAHPPAAQGVVSAPPARAPAVVAPAVVAPAVTAPAVAAPVVAAPVAAPAPPEPADEPGDAPVAAGPRPSRDAVRAANAELGGLVEACVGADYPDRRVRLNVRYDGATGRATVVRVRGFFGRSPVAGCLTAAARRVVYAPFGDGVWEAAYSYPTRGR